MDSPRILEAQITLRPTARFFEDGAQTTDKTRDLLRWLEERYPNWRTEALSYYGAQIGVEALLSMPPLGIFALGMAFALMKEHKI